jgi:hypothetical protein
MMVGNAKDYRTKNAQMNWEMTRENAEKLLVEKLVMGNAGRIGRRAMPNWENANLHWKEKLAWMGEKFIGKSQHKMNENDGGK